VDVEPGFAQAQIRWTRALINQHRVQEAADRGRLAVAVAPRSAEARAALAIALDWGGQVERGVQAAMEAVDLDRTSSAALLALAEVYSDQYRLREADELLAQALELAPDEPEVYRVQGVLRETRADYAGAVESYSHAVDLAPRWSYLYVSLGHAYRALKQYDEALAAFGRAAELSPADARAEGGRGMVYHAREEYEHAAERYQHAIELDPTYATAYAQLAWIHYGRREYDQAEPLFARAIELDRDAGRVAQYRHALGWIYVTSKRPAEAREQFTRALELNPGLQGARDGLALLQGQGQAPRR
jgi:tetratricopeptide (TPR) repeat protein